MARSKKLTDEENKARARRDSHVYRHKKNNISARTHNRAARLAAQWVQDVHPQKWAALVRLAKEIEAGNTTVYVPHASRYANVDCPHDKVLAQGIMRQCANCGMFLGAWAVEEESNKELLQEILEAEGGA
jgi:hypothetical protein